MPHQKTKDVTVAEHFCEACENRWVGVKASDAKCPKCKAPMDRIRSADGREFWIHKLPADIANWIVLQMAKGTFTELDTYQQIKTYLFNLIQVYEPVAGAAPIRKAIFKDGKWLDPKLDLEYDLETVNALFQEAVDFSVGPFLKSRIPKQETPDTSL